jgi:hypothetical protein
VTSRDSIAARLARLDWEALGRALDEQGYATTPSLVTAEEAGALLRLFADDRRFRSTIDMARYRFGVGRYRYFARPLPPVVAALRTHAYRHLAPVANRWMEALGLADRFPPELPAFLARCATRGQRKPTPLLLRYTAGGYNCLHQDLYGALAFPLQMTCLLSRPEADFTGGEILLVEQRPRAQSRGEVVVLRRGEAVIFPTRDRPVKGVRGYHRARMRHGVSRIRSGERVSLGVIFHDAR